MKTLFIVLGIASFGTGANAQLLLSTDTNAGPKLVWRASSKTPIVIVLPSDHRRLIYPATTNGVAIPSIAPIVDPKPNVDLIDTRFQLRLGP